MLISFGDRRTNKIRNAERVKDVLTDIQNTARRKLRKLNNSRHISDLLIHPYSKLEKWKGNLKEFYSIPINNRWPIMVTCHSCHAEEVLTIPYH